MIFIHFNAEKDRFPLVTIEEMYNKRHERWRAVKFAQH